MAGPRVDFYVLPTREPAARLRFACRLVEKAWLRRHRVRVQLDPGGELETFDGLLWTFSDRSFVPHHRQGADETPPAQAPAPVVLADGDATDAGDGDLVVNLARGMPPGLERWARIAEVVDADEERRRLGRERFRQYRERGIQPQTHDMKDEP
ncbi:MAG TPA: DNA polymerase III subunit chi [Steroidobacteraceae bacterium]|nr:DNA polymerase III subunit chi [Steroidobacteraceae bacterium]